jgi:hypothetical protein
MITTGTPQCCGSGSESGSISQEVRYGSADPDPYQHFIDSQHWYSGTPVSGLQQLVTSRNLMLFDQVGTGELVAALRAFEFLLVRVVALQVAVQVALHCTHGNAQHCMQFFCLFRTVGRYLNVGLQR